MCAVMERSDLEKISPGNDGMDVSMDFVVCRQVHRNWDRTSGPSEALDVFMKMTGSCRRMTAML